MPHPIMTNGAQEKGELYSGMALKFSCAWHNGSWGLYNVSTTSRFLALNSAPVEGVRLQEIVDEIPFLGYIVYMQWQLITSKKVQKQVRALPSMVKNNLFALMAEIQMYGPVRGNWPNYGKLSSRRHHCHIKKGRPTYVAVWEEKETTINLVEVTYAGTHEKAPY